MKILLIEKLGMQLGKKKNTQHAVELKIRTNKASWTPETFICFLLQSVKMETEKVAGF